MIDFNGNEFVLIFQFEVRKPVMDTRKPLRMLREAERIPLPTMVDGRPGERAYPTDESEIFEVVEVGKPRGSGFLVERLERTS